MGTIGNMFRPRRPVNRQRARIYSWLAGLGGGDNYIHPVTNITMIETLIRVHVAFLLGWLELGGG